MVGFPGVVLVALGCVWFYQQSELDAQLAALRAKGLPTSGKELNGFYTVPAGIADTTNLWVTANDAVQAANLRTRGSTLPFVGNGVTPVPAPGKAWAERTAARTLLGQLSNEFKAIREAAKAGGQVRFPVDFSAGIDTPLPYTQQSRDLGKLLLLDAHVCAHEGKTSQAVQDLRAIFALSEALRGEPTLISQLVRISIHATACDCAERLMPHCNWTDAELESLQTAVRLARFKMEMSNALCGERATCLTALDGFPLGPFRQSYVREILQLYQSSIEGFSGSWVDILRRQRELDAQMKDRTAGKFARFTLALVSLLLPALDQAAGSGARAEARQRCTHAAIAAQRFRLQYGRLPNSLAEIEQKSFVASTDAPAQFTDPFDGQPLRYKTEVNRVVIYSVGQNEKDDGGNCDRDGGKQPLDIGFSLKK